MPIDGWCFNSSRPHHCALNSKRHEANTPRLLLIKSWIMFFKFFNQKLWLYLLSMNHVESTGLIFTKHTSLEVWVLKAKQILMRQSRPDELEANSAFIILGRTTQKELHAPPPVPPTPSPSSPSPPLCLQLQSIAGFQKKMSQKEGNLNFKRRLIWSSLS